jgi:reductive dehalogenase
MQKESEKKDLNRREFLKLGGFSAFSLAAFLETTRQDKFWFDQSQDNHGEFLIREIYADEHPYQIDDATYQRFDAKNSALGRLAWDNKTKQEFSRNSRTMSEMVASGAAGFNKEDFALYTAAWNVAEISGSNAAMHGLHKGLLQLDPLNHKHVNSDIYAIPWDRKQLTNEEVTQKIKKAAKFYGASLVGIAELDERWVYEKSFNSSSPDESGEIIFTDANQFEPPAPEEGKQAVQDTLTEMEPDDLKEFIINTLDEIDPEELPPGAPDPFIVKTLPAKQIAQMVPLMMKMLPESLLAIFAQKLEIPFGAAEVDPETYSRPRYLLDGTTLTIPKSMQWVIVMAFEMDADAIACSPTATSTSAASSGYSRMTATASSLAEFIRMLGYNAIPCVDMTALSIPMAIDAGLGEMGRNGLLITPKYGPRVQLAKIITDMPLATDQPINFGVEEFCVLCSKCAEKCPGQAISYKNTTDQALDISNNPGVTKWPVDATKCLGASQSLGSVICSTCIQVCPFNQPEGWLLDLTRSLISSKQDSINRIVINLDDLSSKPNQTDPKEFWQSENFIHIREP